MLSNIATNGGHCENSPFFDGWKAYDKNPYHPTRNPQGVIQMGLAENQLSFDLIEEWVKKNPKASICTPEGASEFMETALYQDYHGLPAFRNAVAKFMEKVRGGRAKFDPDRIVMSGGATGAHELISFCLADPGEAFLVPTPYYSGFDRDLCWRTGVKLVPVPCHSFNDFKITRTSLESAYKKAQESNTKIKGLLITNPSNPLGTVLDRQILTTILDFITEKGIHLVCDEIYGATVFSTPDFVSISEILGDSPIHYNPDLIHIIYSLSKDLGIPGFRVGIVYSYNDEVVNCARKMSSFGLVSTQTQRLLAAMLSDSEFTDKFIFKSAQRLAARQSMFTQRLARVGIRCLKSSAGLFCWMDLRPSLTDTTVKSETALWRTILEEVKLNISPGSSFHCSEPGWFRVCFANMDDETMEEALTRIQGWRKKRQSLSICASSLRLSFGRLGESNRTPLASPHWSLMSPHSPLVRAT